jgi:hypothetical protein
MPSDLLTSVTPSKEIRHTSLIVFSVPLASVREFQEALLEANAFEDLPGKSQAAILAAERSRPKQRFVSGT